MKVVCVIGVGLIGGSFSKDIQAHYPEVKRIGIDTNDHYLAEALKLGVIDEIGHLEDVARADLVFIAIPVDATLKILPQVLDLVADHTVVIDAGSTKASLCEAVQNHPKRRHYLSAHPIAGTEFSGPSAAIAGLFKGKTQIICEVEQTAFKLQEKALEVFHALG
ncbi:MAG: prephenate dehydrogenase/arogenate dehydrogenase family protein, partial [Flavobacteriaceae bacterium]|nr:prephenate dehydrogenase/arogenate dehydrogenase family protein [Flavobacteriaceae bacterium]